MFRNLRIYRVTSPWPDSEEALSEILANNAFTPCGSFAERSGGWEAPTGNDDDPLCRRLHGADLLQLRTQSRVLPVAAINEETQSARYEISGVPPGYYVVKAWHKKLKMKGGSAEVGVAAGKTTTLDIDITRAKYAK